MIRTNYGKLALCLAMVSVMTLAGCEIRKVVDVTDIDRMQGTWKGIELSDRGGEWTLVITGDQVEADGPGPEDYSGTIILDETTTPKSARLVIDKCAFEAYVGTTANNIYKLESGKLTLAGTEPGSDTKPTSFEAGNSARVFEFSKVQVQ